MAGRGWSCTHLHATGVCPCRRSAAARVAASALILIPHRSRAAHLPCPDWDALIDDFVALGFLPRGCDRGALRGQCLLDVASACGAFVWKKYIYSRCIYSRCCISDSLLYSMV